MKRRNGVGLLLAALAMSGCLKAKETDRAAYDADHDEFRLVMVLENIDGATSDLDYLGTILQNKDHLIAPVMPGDAFGYAPWFLRLGDHKTAKVSFVEPRKGDMQGIEATASLDGIEIRPGTLFVENNHLGYYHAVTIPGKAIDAIIEQTRMDQLSPLKKSVKEEMERRKNHGKVYTWAELMDQEVKAIKSGSTDHPIKPFMVLEEASLEKMVAKTADVKSGIRRNGKDFEISLPLTPDDRTGMMELWDTWKKASDATAAQKKGDMMLNMQRLPAQAIAVRSNEEGVVLSLDVIKLYNTFAEAFAAFEESRSPTAKASEPTSEVRYAVGHGWSMERDLGAAQIFKDFDAGTLKAFPSPVPVTPGSGLKVQGK